MNIVKCDICKKTISSGTRSVRISGLAIFQVFELCPNCAKPVIKFLRNKKLIKKESAKKYE